MRDKTPFAILLSVIKREFLTFTALVVAFICNPLTAQPIDLSRNQYEHLHGLDLTYSADVGDTLKIDLLIASDFYWEGYKGGGAVHLPCRPRLDGFYQPITNVSPSHIHNYSLYELMHIPQNRV